MTEESKKEERRRVCSPDNTECHVSFLWPFQVSEAARGLKSRVRGAREGKGKVSGEEVKGCEAGLAGLE